MSVVKALALLARVVTGRCEGGRALTNAAQQLCAFVLLVVVPAVLWQLMPLAWDEYRSLKQSIASIERNLEIRGTLGAATDDRHDRAIADLSQRLDRQESRLDGLSDRVSRIEGRRR
jgi:hypothetical protein